MAAVEYLGSGSPGQAEGCMVTKVPLRSSDIGKREVRFHAITTYSHIVIQFSSKIISWRFFLRFPRRSGGVNPRHIHTTSQVGSSHF